MHAPVPTGDANRHPSQAQGATAIYDGTTPLLWAWNTVALRKPESFVWRSCLAPNVMRNGDCCGANSEGICGLSTLAPGCPSPLQLNGNQCCAPTAPPSLPT